MKTIVYLYDAKQNKMTNAEENTHSNYIIHTKQCNIGYYGAIHRLGCDMYDKRREDKLTTMVWNRNSIKQVVKSQDIHKNP